MGRLPTNRPPFPGCGRRLPRPPHSFSLLRLKRSIERTVAEFLGIPATGRAVSFRVVDFVRVTARKMREHGNVVDAGALFAQLQ